MVQREVSRPDSILEAWGARWNKKLGDEVVYDPDAEILSPNPIPLELPALDIVLGGGIPRGRTTIVYGNEGCGKTLLSQLIIAAAQRQGGDALFFDVERTYTRDWFRLTGVNTSADRLQIVRPANLEQAFDMADDALRTIQPAVIVIDSCAAMVPKQMLEASMEDKDFRGLGARKTTEGIKKLTASNKTTALVVINQVRVDMGKTFGNPETMPGGKALRFASSLTLLIRRGTWLTDKSEELDLEELDLDFTAVDTRRDAKYVGFLLWLRTEKNKQAVGYQDCQIKFFFNGTVDPTSALVDLALRRGVIEEVGKGYFLVPGIEKKFHGARNVEKLLKKDRGLANEVARLVREG